MSSEAVLMETVEHLVSVMRRPHRLQNRVRITIVDNTHFYAIQQVVSEAIRSVATRNRTDNREHTKKEIQQGAKQSVNDDGRK